jgi:hypothetical protein
MASTVWFGGTFSTGGSTSDTVTLNVLVVTLS